MIHKLFYIERKTLLFIVILLSVHISAFAEYYIVKGKIFDATDKLTLPQVHVIPDGSNGSGVVADMDGNYSIALTKKEATLSFRFLGYNEVTKKVKFDNINTITLNIGMQPQQTEIAGVQVMGSKYRADAKTSIQSLEVIGLKHIEQANATTLDRALDNVAGLVVVDNEPQMRGGSGFSSGMGSRVMILLDEMPILRADAGRPAWNLIPMEDVSQIEVLKGASSVMFGSAAINGAINVRTAFAKSEPETKVRIYGGFYNKPKDKEKAVWNNITPLLYGFSMAHARKIKKLDLTFAVEYAGDDGYRGPAEKYNPNNIKNNGNEVVRAESRFRANIGSQYNIGKGWVVGLNANFLFSDNNQHHFWYNAGKDIYRAYPGTLSHFKDLMFFIDPSVKYVSRKGGVHTFKNRILISDNKVLNLTGQDAASETYFNDYQYKKTFKKAADLSLLAGASNQYAYSYGSVFSGDAVNLGNAAHFANNFAIFTQLEKSFLKEKNLSIQLGGRWEWCNIDNFSENKPVFQVGANYNIVKSHTYFRASVGQGYRAATIGERYITTVVGNYGFYPNPNLKSETSVNTEVAVRQMFKIGSFEGFVEWAGFYQNYDNYIEFCMGPWRPAVKPNEKYGFKFFNTGPATIKGTEAMIAGQGKIGNIADYQIQLAYTYSLPTASDPNYVYTRTGTMDYTYNNSSYDTTGHILKYRIQHLAKADFSIRFIKRFSLGISAQYFSQMKNFDRIFMDMDKLSPDPASWLDYYEEDLPFEGLYNFYQDNKKGALVFGLRAGMEMNNFTVNIIVNNLLNKEYALRPLSIEAPRQITLQLTYKFTDLNPRMLFKRNRVSGEDES